MHSNDGSITREIKSYYHRDYFRSTSEAVVLITVVTSAQNPGDTNKVTWDALQQIC